MKISTQQGDSLVTYALGSCLGITIYDPVAHVGGLLHVMLPLSTIDPNMAKKNPYMFIDTAVPKLFIDGYKAGAKKERLIIKIAGGACFAQEGEDHFQIGKRNVIMLKKLFWKNQVLVKSHETGGTETRTMSLDIATGLVRLKIQGKEKTL